MSSVEPTEVEALLNGDVASIVPLVTTMARSYTRGNGFNGLVPNAEIRAVVLTASARMADNPAGRVGERVDDLENRFVGAFSWSLAEQFVLNRYRVRAQ